MLLRPIAEETGPIDNSLISHQDGCEELIMRPLNHWLDELLATTGRGSASGVGSGPKTPLIDEFPIGYPHLTASDSSGAARHSGGKRPMSGNEGEAENDFLPDGSSESACSEAPAAVPFVSSGVSRAERLAAIRAQIEAGVYDTSERLEAAVEKLARVLNR